MPDSGGTYFLPRLMGWQKASELAMLGDKVNATEAENMGMLYKVFGAVNPISGEVIVQKSEKGNTKTF